MNAFGRCHPIVNFAYFTTVILFTMFFMHPVCLMVSVVCAFTYSVVLSGKCAARRNLFFMLPLLVVSVLMNSAFNHEGVTILTYLPNGNPLTFEAAVYGLAAAVMIAATICWFSCVHEVFTADKLLYLFGRLIPSISLVLSMALRFVPRFAAQFREISEAQRCVGKDISDGNAVNRIKKWLTVLSILVTWSLENAIETADSMKSRGFGLAGRTSFSIYSFGKRDKFLLAWIIVSGMYVLTGGLLGANHFRYFPSIKGAAVSLFRLSVFAVYFLLCITPVALEALEVYKWKITKSNI